MIVDLLFASSGIEAGIIAAATTLEVLPGVHAATAAIGHLIALKVLARSHPETGVRAFGTGRAGRAASWTSRRLRGTHCVAVVRCLAAASRGPAISRPSETHVGGRYARLSWERDLTDPRGASWRPEFMDAHLLATTGGDRRIVPTWWR